MLLDPSGGRGRTLVRREEKALFCLGMVATDEVLVARVYWSLICALCGLDRSSEVRSSMFLGDIPISQTSSTARFGEESRRDERRITAKITTLSLLR